MSKAKTLKKIEQDMKSGSEQKRIDALLDAFEYRDAGLYLIIQALDDPSQLVREAAHLLLTENQSERAKQVLWNYLPYRHLQPLCTLHFLPKNSGYWGNQSETSPVPYECWSLDYVAFTPDERTLVTYTDREMRTHLWDYRTGELQDELSVASCEDGGHVVLSPDGTYLIHNFQQGLDATSLKQEPQNGGRLGHSTGSVVLEWEPTALAIKSDYTLITGTPCGGAPYYTDSIYIYQLPTSVKEFIYGSDLEILHRLQGHTSRVQSLLLSPDETLLLSQGDDRQNDSHHLWDTRTWELLRTYETSSQWVADCLATRPDGQVLASGDRNHAATVWDLRTDEVLYVLPGKAPTVMSADGRVLICRGELGGLLVWDLATNQKICTLAEDIQEIEPVALSRDRQFLVIRVNDTVQVWA